MTLNFHLRPRLSLNPFIKVASVSNLVHLTWKSFFINARRVKEERFGRSDAFQVFKRAQRICRALPQWTNRPPPLLLPRRVRSTLKYMSQKVRVRRTETCFGTVRLPRAIRIRPANIFRSYASCVSSCLEVPPIQLDRRDLRQKFCVIVHV